MCLVTLVMEVPVFRYSYSSLKGRSPHLRQRTSAGYGSGFAPSVIERRGRGAGNQDRNENRLGVRITTKGVQDQRERITSRRP